jgi:hypothetical protein
MENTLKISHNYISKMLFGNAVAGEVHPQPHI